MHHNEAETPAITHRGCFGHRAAVSESLRFFFRRAVRHVEHPGPDVSFGRGDAETQEERPQVPQHLSEQRNKRSAQEAGERF